MQRLYTRYPFSAAAEIVDSSGAKMRVRVTNISFGGCRLVDNGGLPVGMRTTMRIQEPDQFEATATVVHSNASEMGVMFNDIRPASLLILQKWINQTTEKSTSPA
jgi:c-di-GMP-binding flagellar brake protein YcgR